MSEVLDADLLKTDSSYLRSLRGYCKKDCSSIDNLPNNNAYNELSKILYPYDKNSKTPTVSECKLSLHYVWGTAYKVEAYIEEIGGPERVSYVSKLSDDEIARRMRGEYSHRNAERPKIIELTSADFNDLSNILSVDKIDNLSQMYINESINSYRYSVWDSVPCRDEDLDKLNTLKKQVERVLDNIGRLSEMVVGRYKYSDFGFKDDLKIAIDRIWVLFLVVDEAISNIKKRPRQHKQHESELIENLSDEYKRLTNKNPSGDTRRGKFMDFLSAIEDILDKNDSSIKSRSKNRMGSDLVKATLKKYNT